MKTLEIFYTNKICFAMKKVCSFFNSTLNSQLSTLFVAIILLFSCPAFAQDATMFFPVISESAHENSEPRIIPVASNFNMRANQHRRITRAIIAVPDETRNAGGTKSLISELAGSSNNSVLIVSPQFMIPSDLLKYENLDADEKRLFAIWNLSDWVYGNQSITGNAQNRLLSNMHDDEDSNFINQDSGNRNTISSFEVIDQLIILLSQRDMFPNLNTIVIAGSGLGANFVQRYAMFSSMPENSNIDIRFLVLGANNFLYPTEYRPNMYKNNLTIDESSKCQEMNDYPYGMDHLNPYARKTGRNAARLGYRNLDITYIAAKGADSVSDRSCPAVLQGHNSFDRTVNFQKYLSTLYGEDLSHVFSFISGDNGAQNLYSSKCAIYVLFGKGSCDAENKQPQ